jgi:hypothetical protein
MTHWTHSTKERASDRPRPRRAGGAVCESLTCSVELEDSALDSKEPECEPSPSAKSTRTAEQCLLDIGLESQSTGTSAGSLPKLWPTPQAFDAKDIRRDSEALARAKKKGGCRNLREEVLTSSAADSPVKTSPSPERVLVLQERGVDSGANTTDSLANYDPATSSWRTSQRCLVEGWAPYSETWPRSGMTRSGTAYRLPTLVPLTGETESGSRPTPSAQWLNEPTLEHTQHRANTMTRGLPLSQVVRLYPTPSASDNRDRGNMSTPAIKRRIAKGKQVMLSMSVSETSGRLNPTWVEWLMGFPLGWTVLKHWATRSSRKLSK